MIKNEASIITTDISDPEISMITTMSKERPEIVIKFDPYQLLNADTGPDADKEFNKLRYQQKMEHLYETIDKYVRSFI